MMIWHTRDHGLPRDQFHRFMCAATADWHIAAPELEAGHVMGLEENIFSVADCEVPLTNLSRTRFWNVADLSKKVRWAYSPVFAVSWPQQGVSTRGPPCASVLQVGW